MAGKGLGVGWDKRVKGRDGGWEGRERGRMGKGGISPPQSFLKVGAYGAPEHKRFTWNFNEFSMAR